MSLLSHQSFANNTTPYWASAVQPTTLVSPLTVSGLTNSLTIDAENGQISETAQNLTFNVASSSNVLNFSTSNVAIGREIEVLTPSNSQSLLISQDNASTTLSQGGGGVIQLQNTGGAVKIGTSTTLDTTLFGQSIQITDGGSNSSTLNYETLAFSNVSGLAKVGITGANAFLGTSTAPISTPGVLVNSVNSASVRFQSISNVYGLGADTSGNVSLTTPSAEILVDISGVLFTKSAIDISSYKIVPVGTQFVLKTPTDISAITVSSNGLVNIPNLTTGSGGVQSYSNIAIGQPTIGAPNVWLQWYDISVNAAQVLQPSMDYHLGGFNVEPNNPPNYLWTGAIGVVGNNFSSNPPPTFRTFSSETTGRDGLFATFCLVSNVDYDSNTTSFKGMVIGTANNPEYRMLAGDHNIQIRAFPF